MVIHVLCPIRVVFYNSGVRVRLGLVERVVRISYNISYLVGVLVRVSRSRSEALRAPGIFFFVFGVGGRCSNVGRTKTNYFFVNDSSTISSLVCRYGRRRRFVYPNIQTPPD